MWWEASKASEKREICDQNDGQNHIENQYGTIKRNAIEILLHEICAKIRLNEQPQLAVCSRCEWLWLQGWVEIGVHGCLRECRRACARTHTQPKINLIRVEYVVRFRTEWNRCAHVEQPENVFSLKRSDQHGPQKQQPSNYSTFDLACG